MVRGVNPKTGKRRGGARTKQTVRKSVSKQLPTSPKKAPCKKSAEHLTVAQLRKEATQRKIPGRSKLTTRAQLCQALGYDTCGKRVSK